MAFKATSLNSVGASAEVLSGVTHHDWLLRTIACQGVAEAAESSGSLLSPMDRDT